MSPSFLHTFLASAEAVGTAFTLAAVGIYLHRRQYVSQDGKKTLALLSKQVTMPLLLFTAVVQCNQNRSNEPCPNIASGLSRFWGMLLWPIYVMGWGLVVGYVVAKISQTPRSQMRSLLAACAFPNATAIPIALLAALRLDFPHTANLGSTNPMPYLSIYLLTYPILQWSVGGWLLSQPSAQDDDDDDSFVEMDLDEESQQEEDDDEEACNATKKQQGLFLPNDKSLAPCFETMSTEATALLLESQSSLSQDNVSVVCSTCSSSATRSTNRSSSSSSGWCSCTGGGGAWKQHSQSSKKSGSFSCSSVLGQALRQVLQPPVVGAALGFLVASVSPFRAQLVDMQDRNGNAPLEWAFAALFAVGQAAVPINMIILGVNLSQSLQSQHKQQQKLVLQGLDMATNCHEDDDCDDDEFTMSSKTMVWLVAGKLIIMPVIGCLSVVVFDANWWHLSHGDHAGILLVAAIVFMTPTSNSVVVMVELGKGNEQVKESFAQAVAWQYLAAPILLSLFVALILGPVLSMA